VYGVLFSLGIDTEAVREYLTASHHAIIDHRSGEVAILKKWLRSQVSPAAVRGMNRRGVASAALRASVASNHCRKVWKCPRIQ
jgi:uncharacterized protein YqeY